MHSISKNHLNGYFVMCFLNEVCIKHLKESLASRVVTMGKEKFKREIENKINEGTIKDKYKERLQSSIEIDTYCFSLCLVILEFVFYEAKLKKNLIKLRKIRDNLYGHILGIGVSGEGETLNDETFQKYKEEIKNALNSLANPNSIRSIENDMEEICKRTILVNEESYKNSIKKSFFDDICHDMPEFFEGKELTEKLVHDTMISLITQNKFNEIFEKRYGKDVSSIQEGINQILSLQQKNQQQHKVIEPAIRDASFEKMHAHLANERKDNLFGILILIGLDRQESLQETVLEMLKRLASYNCWNMILDFHEGSLNMGIYASVKPERNKSYYTMTLDQLTNYKIESNSNIKAFLQNYCYYLKCNGCQEDNKAKYSNIRKYMRYFVNLTVDLVKESPNSLNFTTLTVLGDQGLSELVDAEFKIDLIMSNIRDVCGDPNAEIKIDYTIEQKNFLISSLPNERVKDCFAKFEEFNMECLTGIPFKIVMDNLGKEIGPKDSKIFYLPAKYDSRSKIDQEALLKYKKYFNVYHLNYGERNIDIEDKDQDLANEKLKESFLKGEALTPKMLWLNEIAENGEQNIFIKRSVEDEIFDAFYDSKQNKPGEVWNKVNDIFMIAHNRSAGATTLARSLLYRLRKYFICLEVIQLDREEIIRNLKFLKSEIFTVNLVLMIEENTAKSASCNIPELKDFQERLRNVGLKGCKIIYVYKNSKSILRSECLFKNSKQIVYLSTTLENSEKKELSSIYPLNKENKLNYQFSFNKIHFYSLYYFNEDFVGIDGIVDNCFKNLECAHGIFNELDCDKCKEKLILFLVSYIEYLTSDHLNKLSAAIIYKKEKGLALIDNAFRYKEPPKVFAFDEMLVLCDEGKSIKLAHACLAERILNKLSIHEPMKKLSGLMIKLVKEQPVNKEFKRLLVDMLINTKRKESDDYKTKKCPESSECKIKKKCVNFHSVSERRRNVKNSGKMIYLPNRCKNVFANFIWENPAGCPKGDKCEFCHTESEYDFHPKVFKFLDY
jgi:hypothetical protein